MGQRKRLDRYDRSKEKSHSQQLVEEADEHADRGRSRPRSLLDLLIEDAERARISAKTSPDFS
jgi:hypothetical protein